MSSVKGLNPNFLPLNRNGVQGPRGDGSAEIKRPDGRDPKMMEAAKSFETQFIRQMIGEMRKTVPKDELVGESMADDIYRGQLDDQYAQMWSDQGGIGLADLIYQQLQERYGAAMLPQGAPRAISPKQEKFYEVPVRHAAAATGAESPAGPRAAPAAESAARRAVAPRATGGTPAARAGGERPHDLLSRYDGDLFLAKKVPGGFALKSREPLPESVDLRSPLSGIVLQSAALPDGKEMVVIKHDDGLVTQLVHSGYNRVKTNMRVRAGETVAQLPSSRNGELAHVFFGLREAAKTE